MSKARHVRLVALMVLCLLANLGLAVFWAHVLGSEGISLTLLVISDVRGVRFTRCTCVHARLSPSRLATREIERFERRIELFLAHAFFLDPCSWSSSR